MTQGLKNIIQSVINDSTIHSVNQRKKSTRLFWIIVLCLSIAFFGLYSYDAYHKWLINPDFLTRIHLRYVKEIPFPALTICSNLFARDQLANSKIFQENHVIPKKFADNMTSNEANYLMSNLQATYSPYLTEFVAKYAPNRTETDIVKLLNESSLNTNEILFNCVYKTRRTGCEYIFNRVLTDRGYCYSSNMEGFNTIFNDLTISNDFHSYKRTKIRKSRYGKNPLYNLTFNDDEDNTKWTLEKGFEENHDEDEVPRMAQKRTQSRVAIFLNKSDANNMQLGVIDTFSYQLHLPNEISTPIKMMEPVNFYDSKFIFLTAKMFKASDDIRMYSPNTRGCYFDGERFLRFFKTYTKDLCEFECMANYTLNKCKCVKFSMPRDDKTLVCNETQTQCYFDAMKGFPKFDSKTKQLENCNCLKTCSDIKYEIVKIKNSKLDDKEFLIRTKKKVSDGDVFAMLTIEFTTPFIEEEEMYASYTFENFIADTGGLLAFLMDCSLLSIVKIFLLCSQIITQIAIYLWNKFRKRNRVQNFITVRPRSRISNNQLPSNDIRRFEHNLMDLEEKIQQILNDQQQKFQQEIFETRRQLENHEKFVQQRLSEQERRLLKHQELFQRKINEIYDVIINQNNRRLCAQRW